MGLQWRLRQRSLKRIPWVTIAILALKSAKTLWSGVKIMKVLVTDLSSISDREIEAVYNELNLRPRKRLGWECPWEVYHHQTLHLL